MPRPQRTCSGCGSTRSQEDLIRMVRGPEGRLHFDLAGRLPGRGAYVCPDAACLAAALKAKKLRAVFRGETAVPAPLEARESLSREFRERFLALLGMAARSGAVVSGHDAVARSLSSGAAFLLVTARDLAAGSRDDLVGLAGGARVIEFGGIEELGCAIGQPGRGTVSVTNAALARAMALTYDRSAAFGLKI